MTNPEQAIPTAESETERNPSTAEAADGTVQSPEFQTFTDRGTSEPPQPVSRFGGIKVAVSGELGRAQVSIERLLTLGKGSVLELDRAIDSPIELVAQGIPLATGEVVVVDGHFAVRILEVYPRNRRGERLNAEQNHHG